jgi:hypothetical protein
MLYTSNTQNILVEGSWALPASLLPPISPEQDITELTCSSITDPPSYTGSLRTISTTSGQRLKHSSSISVKGRIREVTKEQTREVQKFINQKREEENKGESRQKRQKHTY